MEAHKQEPIVVAVSFVAGRRRLVFQYVPEVPEDLSPAARAAGVTALAVMASSLSSRQAGRLAVDVGLYAADEPPAVSSHKLKLNTNVGKPGRVGGGGSGGGDLSTPE
eukprot:scaffold2.g6812.t1